MNYIKKFENFNPYDDEPLSRTEQHFGIKMTRLEKQYHKIAVDGLVGDDDNWAYYSNVGSNLKELLEEGKIDLLTLQEFMTRIVEGENPKQVCLDVIKKVGFISSELKRLYNKILNF